MFLLMCRLVDSTVGLPWGVKLRKPSVDAESGLYPPNDQPGSQESPHYKAGEPIIGRSFLDELQTWEHEQGERNCLFVFFFYTQILTVILRCGISIYF